MTASFPFEPYLKGLSLIYNRLGDTTEQSNQDFELLVDSESWSSLRDLIVVLASISAVLLEEIEGLYEGLAGDGLVGEDPVAQARAILDTMRDMFISQGINEPS